jgi:hypothetical protein
VPGGGVDQKDGRNYVAHDFLIKPDNLKVDTSKLPKFQFEGKISSINCCFNEPFSGYLICQESDLQIKSVEI